MYTTQERHSYIVRLVEEKGSVRVADLSAELQCSEVTIRNDIRKLDSEGLLKKVHGGAEARREGLSITFPQGEYFWNKAEKNRIAQQAYHYINSRDSIIIDDSTTGYYLAKVIAHSSEKQITVVTNSILTAAELAGASHVELFMVSGHIMGVPPAALDTFTVNAFAQFNVNKAFIGISGINLHRGLASLGAPQRDVKKAIVNTANQVYVLADHTKFDGSSLFNVCPMSSVTRIITDNGVRPEVLSLAKTLNIKLDAV